MSPTPVGIGAAQSERGRTRCTRVLDSKTNRGAERESKKGMLDLVKKEMIKGSADQESRVAVYRRSGCCWLLSEGRMLAVDSMTAAALKRRLVEDSGCRTSGCSPHSFAAPNAHLCRVLVDDAYVCTLTLFAWSHQSDTTMHSDELLSLSSRQFLPAGDAPRFSVMQGSPKQPKRLIQQRFRLTSFLTFTSCTTPSQYPSFDHPSLLL